MLAPSNAITRLSPHADGGRAADCDIVVAGAGAAGLSAAIALAQAGFRVACVGTVERRANGRTVALFEGSLRFYRALGLWPRLRELAAPLRRIKMIDDTGARFPAPPVAFAATEVGFQAFGDNIENHRLVDCLAAAAEATAGLTLHDAMVADVTFTPDLVEIDLEGGGRLSAKLLVAADGRRSIGREKAGIAARPWRYPQAAVTTTLAHARPHADTSIEFHTRTGPCTLVPLQGRDGRPHRSSLVWLMTPAEAERRSELDDAALAAEITRQTHAVFGAVTIDGPRGHFPMSGLKVSRLTGHRIALVGEAAHVFPPLAAQGLNLSLRDGATLVDTLRAAAAAGRDIGAREVLAAYGRSRATDIAVRTNGIDVLNRSFLADFVPVDLVRGAGMAAFAMIGPLRRAVMREGILPPGDTPSLMRQPPRRRAAAPSL
jgi:2-octaprenyl-6-methoxyphenol hydroxylase